MTLIQFCEILGSTATLLMMQVFNLGFRFTAIESSRSWWPRVLRRRSVAARQLRLWVRIPPGAWLGRPDHDQQHCYHHAPTVKSEAATAVVVAPDNGREDARNMFSCI
jgi:hypothetical protein